MPKRPEDLLQHNCIQFEIPSTGRTQPWQFQRDGRRISVPVRGNLRLDHAEAMVEAALAGTALVQISSYVTAPALARRQLQSVLTAYQVESLPIWAMYSQTSSPTPRLRAFLDFLVKWGASGNFA